MGGGFHAGGRNPLTLQGPKWICGPHLWCAWATTSSAGAPGPCARLARHRRRLRLHLHPGDERRVRAAAEQGRDAGARPHARGPGCLPSSVAAYPPPPGYHLGSEVVTSGPTRLPCRVGEYCRIMIQQYAICIATKIQYILQNNVADCWLRPAHPCSQN